MLHPHNRLNPPTPTYIVGNGFETITRSCGAGCRAGFELWEMTDQDHGTNFEYDGSLLQGQPYPSDMGLSSAP
jgi:hypothetical protein